MTLCDFQRTLPSLYDAIVLSAGQAVVEKEQLSLSITLDPTRNGSTEKGRSPTGASREGL